MTERPPKPDTGSILWKRWQEVDRLFEAALDRPSAQRETFLRVQCANDAELFQIVAELLEITGTEDTPVDRPGSALLRAALQEEDTDDTSALQPGESVGRYRIIGEIGRGGMATVYEAERADGSFERRVAVKVLRRGIDTDDVVRRFLAERQILSGLTHPNVARLLDGGATPDGRPFLVMDRVEGEPITRWADARKLPIVDRLRLFLQVADAVHHAHQRLVVHRDLKPSNILVTDDGQAKLLDFGIARLLSADGDDGLTGIGPRPLTPRYASPEQLRGETVTTRSDVYQLGILLHVLLTGSGPRPRTAAGPDGETEFTRPSSLLQSSAARTEDGPAAGRASVDAAAAARSTRSAALRRALRGDLDTIVLVALRPDPADRYDSAAAMADDVRRHLGGLPISARPPSIGYRLGRFIRRNRWFLPTAAILTGTLVTVAVMQVRHARQLERERNEARVQADRADQLRSVLVNLFGSADPFSPADSARGRGITVVNALEIGAERARTELAGQPLLLADLLSAIARVHENLDQRRRALALLNETLALRDSIGGDPTPEYAEDVGRRATLLGLIEQNDSSEAERVRHLDLERQVFGDDHPRVAGAIMALSWVPAARGDHLRQLELLDEAVDILRRTVPPATGPLGDALAYRADALRSLGRPGEALDAARESLGLQLSVTGAGHPTAALRRVHLAQVLDALGRIDEAVALYREALPVLEKTLGPDHYNTLRTWNNLGTVLSNNHDPAGAEAVHRRILESRLRIAGTDLSAEVAGSIQNLAAAVLRQGRYAEADSLAREAGRIYDAVLPDGHYLRAFPRLTLAESQLLQEDPGAAERSARTALGILEEALPDHYATAVARCRLGAALVARGADSDGRILMGEAFTTLTTSTTAPARLVDECRTALASPTVAPAVDGESAASGQDGIRPVR